MKKLLALILCFCAAFAAESSKKTVCLNMIVKNESKVIRRCLASVKDTIDYWVIVDTGSTDGTQEIIKEFMKDIPGELHEQPWVNFGHNRNAALQLAKKKGDYSLFIDADETLEGSFDRKSLEKDVYIALVRTLCDPLTVYQRALLINNSKDWSWQGVIHEKLVNPKEATFEVLQNVALSAEARDGHRSLDPEKYLKDAKILEKALIDDPYNAEYLFYLAQSYYNAKELKLALKTYEKRAKMEGWDQHTFWAKYQIPLLQEKLEMDPQLIIKNYCEAFQYRPTRAEPICCLAQYFYTQKNYLLGYLLAQFGMKIPPPNDFVYVEQWMYSYGLLAVLANCAFELGKYDEAAAVYDKIAQVENIPPSIYEQAKKTNREARLRVIQTRLTR